MNGTIIQELCVTQLTNQKVITKLKKLHYAERLQLHKR